MMKAQILMGCWNETKSNKFASKTPLELIEGLARIVTYVAKIHI